MNRRTAERFALVALVGLIVYGLACMFPVAWSPDSERLVFPVMTDLQGNILREVDRVESERASLSPAAWSPNAKSIAYMKLEEKTAPTETGSNPTTQPEPVHASVSLIVQDAASSEKRTILREEAPGGPDARELWAANVAAGVQWSADSKQLLVRRAVAGRLQVALVNVKGGKVEKVLEVSDKTALASARLSPDGKRLAWMQQLKEALELHLMDVPGGEDTKICSFSSEEMDKGMPALQWAADGRGLYVGLTGRKPAREPLATVKLVGLNGARRTVWQKERASSPTISVSSRSGLLAVDYGLRTEQKKKQGPGFGPHLALFFGIDVVDPQTGKALPVHFGELHLSTSISPDGRWVAYCVPCKVEGLETEAYSAGVIVSTDGSEVRFFLPDARLKEAIPQILRDRLEGAIRASGVTEELPLLEKPREATVEQAQEAVASAERMLLELDAPIFREAAAYGKVAFYLAVLKQKPVDERECFQARLP